MPSVPQQTHRTRALTATESEIAVRWQHRLGIEDWPIIYAIARIPRPLIFPGDRDLIVLPEDTDEIMLLDALLEHALANVPQDQQITDLQRADAARQLVATWPKGAA